MSRMWVLLQYKGGAVAARAAARGRPHVRDGPVRADRSLTAGTGGRRATGLATSTAHSNNIIES